MKIILKKIDRKSKDKSIKQIPSIYQSVRSQNENRKLKEEERQTNNENNKEQIRKITGNTYSRFELFIRVSDSIIISAGKLREGKRKQTNNENNKKIRKKNKIKNKSNNR